MRPLWADGRERLKEDRVADAGSSGDRRSVSHVIHASSRSGMAFGAVGCSYCEPMVRGSPAQCRRIGTIGYAS
jgi:hypothetical protein